MNAKKIRTDFIIVDSNGTEIGNGEIKPINTFVQLQEEDRMRVIELAKKQLHRRMRSARSDRGLDTFGIFFNGREKELHLVKRVHGTYEVYLIDTL